MNIIYKSPFDRQHKVLEILNKQDSSIVRLDELKRRILIKEVRFYEKTSEFYSFDHYYYSGTSVNEHLG